LNRNSSNFPAKIVIKPRPFQNRKIHHTFVHGSPKKGSCGNPKHGGGAEVPRAGRNPTARKMMIESPSVTISAINVFHNDLRFNNIIRSNTTIPVRKAGIVQRKPFGGVNGVETHITNPVASQHTGKNRSRTERK